MDPVTRRLPQFATPFVGRGEELAQIAGRLHDPACRLLTLVGPGGAGKTRLAVAAARQEAADFAHGVCFVPLQAVTTAADLTAAVADAVGLSLSGSGSRARQLGRYLAEKETLLLLDNLEQLLVPPAAEQTRHLISHLLNAAPALTLVATSRQPLSLQQEWLFPVGGLAYPATADVPDLLAYEAVTFFVARARQVAPGFSVADKETCLVRITQLLAGLPLALEMAASWIRTLSCAAIAAEIEADVTFLSTKLQNVPPRHRSMLVVLDHTWVMLRPEEQAVLMQLSIFRGDFDRPAAAAVAGASLPILLGLVDKSILHREGKRYYLHQLTRQYAHEKSEETPAARRDLNNRYSSYYARFLAQRLDHLLGGRQRETVAEIEPELDNIRAAWRWAVAAARLDDIARAAPAFSLFFQFRGRFLEGATALAQAADVLQQAEATARRDLTLAQVLVDLGWLYIRLGRLEKAEAVLNQCHAIYQGRQMPPVAGHGTDPALALGIIASIRGDHKAAERLGEGAREASEAHDQPLNRQFAYYLLSRAAQAQGDYETARAHARQALSQAQANEDQWFMAYCHNELGNVALATAAYDEARRHFQESFALRGKFDDPEGMGLALNLLGETAVRQRQHQVARRLFQRSQTIYQELNDRGGLATARRGLGQAATALGNYEAARSYLQQALQMAADIPFVPLILASLLAIGDLWLQTGRREQGMGLLGWVRWHPAGDQQIQAAAAQLIAEHDETARRNRDGARRNRDGARRNQDGARRELDEVVAATLAALARRPDETAAQPGTPAEETAATSPLVEPLTPREMDVLRLLAEGLSNREIAAELTVVVGTVKAHNHHIYTKLDVDNRTAAVARARELGLI